jgi:PhzF family phenazine biosynthesis protein
MRAFSQVDVFTDEFTKGNALAVVHGADGLTTEEMAAFANWTNLSETTFLLSATDPAADYRLRIFTTARELPFAGHPTVGSARAWLAAGGVPHSGGELVQECGVGLVRLRRSGDRLAFAAPPRVRSGPVDEADLAQVVRGLQLSRDDVVDAQWCANGPDWMALLMRDADAVLKVEPDAAGFGPFSDIGLVGPSPSGSDVAFEVRALVAESGVWEDPVTGSLNAGIAQWLIGAGIAPASYVVAQGTRLGRKGRVHVEQADGEIWIGGDSVIGIRGAVEI